MLQSLCFNIYSVCSGCSHSSSMKLGSFVKAIAVSLSRTRCSLAADLDLPDFRISEKVSSFFQHEIVLVWSDEPYHRLARKTNQMVEWKESKAQRVKQNVNHSLPANKASTKNHPSNSFSGSTANYVTTLDVIMNIMQTQSGPVLTNMYHSFYAELHWNVTLWMQK